MRYWKRQVRGIFDLGFDGFMQDFGEEVLLGMHFHDGQTGVTMHNRYLTLYHRATREEIDALRAPPSAPPAVVLHPGRLHRAPRRDRV